MQENVQLPVPRVRTDFFVAGKIHVAAEAVDTPDSAAQQGAQADASPYGTPLAIGDAGFSYGLGSLANTRMEVLADGKYTRFAAKVGINKSTQGIHASAEFMVVGDGRLLAKSGPMASSDAALELGADIAGIKPPCLLACMQTVKFEIR